MSTFLQVGGNTVLQQPAGRIVVSYEASPTIDVSLTAFLLTAAEKVEGDDGIIFYNQPTTASGAATLHGTTTAGGRIEHTLAFDLTKLPATITKIAVTLTEDRHTGFTNVQHLRAHVMTASETIELAPASFEQENGIVVAELYVRNHQQKAKSVWRGFNAGLSGLCTLYGVEFEDEPSTPAAEPVAEQPKEVKRVVSIEKVTGNVNLQKGQKSVIIEKTPVITATVSWQTGTDYDIYALVYTKSGEQVDVATFGAKGVKPLQRFANGAVEHMGDVGRTNDAVKTEVIKLKLTDDIVAVVPVVYSAQSNGTGSFYRYKVSMSIDNHHGTSVTIASDNANNNDRIYTCVPGILHNTTDGVIITPLELYSKPKSENRPKLVVGKEGRVEVDMDAGPRNNYK